MAENSTEVFEYNASQNYEKLRRFFNQAKFLFEDDEFPPNETSLNNTGEENEFNVSKIVWKRAGELGSNPKFLVDGASRFDVNQGGIGNCWVLASIANLTMKKKLFAKVVPSNQSFDENYYAGKCKKLNNK